MGAEALISWNHAERGPVSPTAFIPLAERTGQIEKLGRIALEQATEQTRISLPGSSSPRISLFRSIFQPRN